MGQHGKHRSKCRKWSFKCHQKGIFFKRIRVEYHDVQCAVCWEMVTTLWRKSSTQLSDVGVLVCSYGFKACYYCSSKGL